MTAKDSAPLCPNVGETPERNLRFVRRLATALLVALLIGLAASAQGSGCPQVLTDAPRLTLDWLASKEQERSIARLEAQVASIREALRIPGLSAAVVQDGELIWAQGFGIANPEEAIPATAATPYGLASVTKPFAAILLMQLVEGEQLDLDALVGDFGLGFGNDDITVRHLLTHTSEGVPGAAYRYSGDRYSYLTTVIEQLYGESFRAVLRREILGPLGMDDTALNVGGCGLAYYASTLGLGDPERAHLHVYEDAAPPYTYDRNYEVYRHAVPTYANAAAGLISNVIDLARFAVAVEDDALVSAESKERMFAPTVLNSGEHGPYGLGWFTETVDGTRLVWHYGYGAYSTLFLMVPAERLPFIALANTQNLSRPFGLGMANVSVLASPLALAFYKEFVLDPRLRDRYPEIDWTVGTEAIVGQIDAIEDPALRGLAERELWSTRKLYAGIGDRELALQLLMAHYEAFPGAIRSSGDLVTAGSFGRRPAEPDEIELSDGETARWIGRYVLRAEDAATGLPLEIEMHAEEGRLIAVPTDDACQEFAALTPTRLVSTDDRDLFLIGEGEAGPFASVAVEYHGAVIAAYERVD